MRSSSHLYQKDKKTDSIDGGLTNIDAPKYLKDKISGLIKQIVATNAKALT